VKRSFVRVKWSTDPLTELSQFHTFFLPHIFALFWQTVTRFWYVYLQLQLSPRSLLPENLCLVSVLQLCLHHTTTAVRHRLDVSFQYCHRAVPPLAQVVPAHRQQEYTRDATAALFEECGRKCGYLSNVCVYTTYRFIRTNRFTRSCDTSLPAAGSSTVTG
jgi:hypothetical protein